MNLTWNCTKRIWICWHQHQGWLSYPWCMEILTYITTHDDLIIMLILQQSLFFQLTLLGLAVLVQFIEVSRHGFCDFLSGAEDQLETVCDWTMETCECSPSWLFTDQWLPWIDDSTKSLSFLRIFCCLSPLLVLHLLFMTLSSEDLVSCRCLC